MRPIKRALDILGAMFLLLVLAPFLLLIVLALKIEGATAIYSHERIGRLGRRFYCYKFRTMVANSDVVLNRLLEQSQSARDEWTRDHKLKHDPRVTKLGEFLRRTSSDELPQLWNVLIGEMSLVGPRPVTDAETLRYGEYLPDYLSVRPGITGLWQVSGRNETSYQQRVALDAYYVRHWSLALDMHILLKTVRVVISGRGAY